MKATSSISAGNSNKVFGLDASNAADGQSSGGAGFLAMLDGMIQTSGAGSNLPGASDQGNNGQSQADANPADAQGDDAAAALATTPQDEAILADVVAKNTTSSLVAVSAATLANSAPQSAQPIIISTITAPIVAQPNASKATISASASATPFLPSDALAALAVQAGLVPTTQTPTNDPRTISSPVNDGSAANVVASNSPAVTAPSAEAALVVPVKATIVLDGKPAKAQAPSQSDQDNSDTQQSAILSALFAQAPLQVLPQATQASTVDKSSAKSVSGAGPIGPSAGIASVPGAGIPPTLSPPAFVGNGSNNVSAHLIASSSSNDDTALAAAPATQNTNTPPSFGIGTSFAASNSESETADDDASLPQPLVVTPATQVKADAIASLFAMPSSVKAVKTDDTDVKDDSFTSLAPASADIGSTGLTLVHQASTTNGVTTISATTASSQLYASSPADQVSLVLQRAANNGPQTMTIALNPIELGKVEVKLDFAKDGSVQASVTADRPETLSLLKNDHTTLTQALHNAGLTTTSGSLSFNLRDGGASQQQQQGFGSASSYRPGSSAANADADAPVSPNSTSTIQYAVSNGNGRLDVTV